MKKIRVTVWNEFFHEKTEEDVKAVYPDGIHNAIKNFLSECDDFEITAVTLDMPSQGITDELLENTDVLIWWGHMLHDDVSDSLTEKIRQRVYEGKLGFIPLHSAHKSKPFMNIVGTNGNLYFAGAEREIIWNMDPSHPISAGIPEHFKLDVEEMYGEPFYIPKPDDLIFGAWFEHGNIFRAGCTWKRGAGKVFYFQPGHESFPSYHNPYVQRIIKNAVYWVAPADFGYSIPNDCRCVLDPVI